MNNAEQTIYWHQYNAFTRGKVNQFRPAVYKALRGQLLWYKDNRNIDMIPMQPIADVIRTMYVETGRLWAHKAYFQLRTQAYKTRQPLGFNEEIINRILQYFQLKLLNDAVLPILETTKDFIRDQLSIGISKGLSIDDIVDEIIKSGTTAIRARRITRTEIMKATNYAEQLGIDKTGLQTLKIWIATRDNRTRDDHLYADGQTVPDAQPFIISPKKYPMQRPGDTSHIINKRDAAAEVVNCRCVVGRKVLRGANGLPLRV